MPLLFVSRQVTNVVSNLSDVKGKVIIVTGSNSEIGKETVIALVSMEATVIMAVRNIERGKLPVMTFLEGLVMLSLISCYATFLHVNLLKNLFENF